MQKETELSLSWLEQNEMIANPEKCHAIMLRKNQTNTCGEQIIINGEKINLRRLELLGVRLKTFVGFQEKKIFVQSFVHSNSNYRFGMADETEFPQKNLKVLEIC